MPEFYTFGAFSTNMDGLTVSNVELYLHDGSDVNDALNLINNGGIYTVKTSEWEMANIRYEFRIKVTLSDSSS